MIKLFHKISFSGRLHGWNLKNVQLDCGEIAESATLQGNRPLGELAVRDDTDSVLRQDEDLCATCFVTDQPRAGCDNYIVVST
jgi:hypothetical protein